MTHLELRRRFLEFWKEKPRNHIEVPSSSLVPENDPTTLFTGSGMQPLIPYLLGQPHPLGKKLVDIQKCFRGQDIDEVGDNRHDTFFEMMGNWSLGDYFKKDQLSWYWDFLKEIFGDRIEKLHVTCFEGYKNIPKDTESAEIWKSLGIPEEKIHFYGTAHNWWSRSGEPQNMPVGEIGGPDSEVFYEFDIPHDPKSGKECHPNCQCGKFLEIGNSVFIQYQKQPDGSFKELPQKNVDFGGGLERTLMALDNNPDIFLTDVYLPIIRGVETLSNHAYKEDPQLDKSFRIIADHLKAAVFLIADGVTPSNKDRGYVLRRLIRRAIRFTQKLGVKENLTGKIVSSIIDTYQDLYKELGSFHVLIHDTIQQEETKSREMLNRGLTEFQKLAAKGHIDGQDAFYLYESFGFPYELTVEEAKDKNIKVVTLDEFLVESERHQEKSRSASKEKFQGGLADHSEQVVKYHTATHLLHAALRQILGDHVRQEGSNITVERLRFDFSHLQKLTGEEIGKVEEIVNSQIQADLERKVETLPYSEAIKSGAVAFFKEKYPEKVTVYSFGDPSASPGQVFSKEICGGPHVEHTGILGKFKIIKEEAVATSIRRIYATLT